MSSIDREQSLFWSEIREEERSEESKTAVTASGNQRGRLATLHIALARSRPTAPLCWILLCVLTHGFLSKKERLLAVYALNQEVCL